MDIFSLLLISVSLAIDAGAVAAADGMSICSFTKKHAFIIALYFGAFQFLMPLIGYYLAGLVTDRMTGWTDYLAFALLVIIGSKMIWEALRGENKCGGEVKGFSHKTVAMQAVATSIDALAVGISFAALSYNIWLSASVIGIVAFVISAVSALLGDKLAKLLSGKAEALGGLVLIGIGIKILIEHFIG